jgi:4-amino-4-deoxy-L-arabinose transferase-like glycosyltransferase
MWNKRKIRDLLSGNFPLLVVLIGVALISLPIGPYETPDTQVEFSTAQGVLTWGYPYWGVKGNFLDVPPLGFYVEALFFLIFGLTMENGVALITILGLACIVVVYKLGKEVYSKSTGLFAAALFALSPWELILTRAFLIDVQCLLLSMAFLYFGILAIRRDSVKLALVSGVFFAAAFLTKQYAVFMLIPLLLLCIYHHPKNPRQILIQLGVFCLPAVFSSLYWYQVVMGKELLYLLQHNDFTRVNFPGVIPSYSFIVSFLIDNSLGIFFVAAAIFSLVIGVLSWKRFSNESFFFELVFLLTILVILGVNVYLGVTLNLKAPYTSAVKYSYQSLPLFSLVAASLAGKSASFIRLSKRKPTRLRILLFSGGLFGFFLLVGAVVANMVTAQWLTTVPHVIFRVQPGVDVGYSFVVLHPISPNMALLNGQFLGFMLVFSVLLWSSRPFIFDIGNERLSDSSKHSVQPYSSEETVPTKEETQFADSDSG